MHGMSEAQAFQNVFCPALDGITMKEFMAGTRFPAGVAWKFLKRWRKIGLVFRDGDLFRFALPIESQIFWSDIRTELRSGKRLYRIEIEDFVRKMDPYDFIVVARRNGVRVRSVPKRLSGVLSAELKIYRKRTSPPEAEIAVRAFDRALMLSERGFYEAVYAIAPMYSYSNYMFAPERAA